MCLDAEKNIYRWQGEKVRKCLTSLAEWKSQVRNNLSGGKEAAKMHREDHNYVLKKKVALNLSK